ncbi:hypothetical protein AVEN_158871-1 [Araneus ventricosus]|uniref:Uncharacterized protein n=1 Tax=Araneus ventricosus TaxID=182803 RepID=A0A4Y2E5X7_ARAVE|nr:hypothetical protein AVEN_158871-1 [Araneus ventricosus]
MHNSPPGALLFFSDRQGMDRGLKPISEEGHVVQDSLCCDSSLGKEVRNFISRMPDMCSNTTHNDICIVKEKSLNFSGYFARCVSIGYGFQTGLAIIPNFDVTLKGHRIFDCFVYGCHLCLVP